MGISLFVECLTLTMKRITVITWAVAQCPMYFFDVVAASYQRLGTKEPVIVEEQIYDAMMKHNGRIAFRIDVALEIANQLPEGKTRDLLAQEIRISERRSNEFKHSSNV